MECLKEDIPPRYHRYIPRSYSDRSTQDSECRSNISTIHLPMPSYTSGANRFNHNQQLDSTSAAEPPSYRSRSNVQVTLMLPNTVCPRILYLYQNATSQLKKQLPGAFIESEPRDKSP